MKNVRQLFTTFFTSFFLNRSGFSCLFIICSVAFWVCAGHSVLAKNDYLLPSDYLGTPAAFIDKFTKSLETKLNEYFGLLVSFVGLRYVLKAFLG